MKRDSSVVSPVRYICSCSVHVPWMRDYDSWWLWYKTMRKRFSQTHSYGVILGVSVWPGLILFAFLWFFFGSPSSLLPLQFGYVAFAIAYYLHSVSCPIWLSGNSVYGPASRMKGQCASHINSFIECVYVRMYKFQECVDRRWYFQR